MVSVAVERPRLEKRPQYSDEEIVERAYEALSSSGYQLLRNLQVYCDHGRVTLQGRLPTYFLKQLSQSIIRRVDGVRDIDNDIRVRNF